VSKPLPSAAWDGPLALLPPLLGRELPLPALLWLRACLGTAGGAHSAEALMILAGGEALLRNAVPPSMSDAAARFLRERRGLPPLAGIEAAKSGAAAAACAAGPAAACGAAAAGALRAWEARAPLRTTRTVRRVRCARNVPLNARADEAASAAKW
jgi:hypothetical protein